MLFSLRSLRLSGEKIAFFRGHSFPKKNEPAWIFRTRPARFIASYRRTQA